MSSDSRALWASGGSGQLQLALRAGGEIDIRGETKALTRISLAKTRNAEGGNGGHGEVINPAGTVALHLTYRGGEGIFLLAPATLDDEPDYTEWIATFTGLSALEQHPLANPDTDLLPNIIERGLGLNPVIADPATTTGRLPRAVVHGGQVAMQFSMPDQPPGDLSYSIWLSPDLTPGSGSVVATKTGVGPWSGSAGIAIRHLPGSELAEVTITPPMTGVDGGRQFMWLELKTSSD